MRHVTGHGADGARSTGVPSRAFSAREPAGAGPGDTAGDPPGPAPSENEFGIAELAGRTGMSVRNIRAHQSRRLLHPPRRTGRRSVYDHSHVERLRLIRRLQDVGFSLSAIRALVRSGNEAGELALAWRAEAIAMRFLPGEEFDEARLKVEPEGMAALLSQPGALERLERYGLTRRTPCGDWQGTHPLLVDAGRRARRWGVPSTDIVRVSLRIAAAAEGMAEEIVSTFRQHTRGRHDQGRDPVLADYAMLSPIAAAIVTATFEVQLARVVREAFGLAPDELP